MLPTACPPTFVGDSEAVDAVGVDPPQAGLGVFVFHVAHLVGLDGFSRRPILRGDDEGPVKTGPDLAKRWCAILGLNLISNLLE